jgi:uncharacterized membrane protein (UPF0127 family)
MGFSARACPWGLGGSWLLILCLAVILGGPARAQSALQVFERDSLVVATASGEEHRFEVELATTWQQQAQGLMYRKALAPDAGMLFIYSREDELTMWMKNTLIPLDMLFIDRDGRIVSLSERTVPLSLKRISSGLPALAVLELNAGTVARLGLKPGDRIIHRAFGT